MNEQDNINKEKPLSETISDAEIARILKENGLEGDAKTIDFMRDTQRFIEGYLRELDDGKPVKKILAEMQINVLRRN